MTTKAVFTSGLEDLIALCHLPLCPLGSQTPLSSGRLILIYPQGTLSLRERLRDSLKDAELMNGRVRIQNQPLADSAPVSCLQVASSSLCRFLDVDAERTSTLSDF